MVSDKKYTLLIMVLMLGFLIFTNNYEIISKSFSEDERGYNLLIADSEMKEAENDCKRVMELISDIYINADKGNEYNAVLADEIILDMQSRVRETGCPVYSIVLYSNMENYQEMEAFIEKCEDAGSCTIVTYEINSEGNIFRRKYFFDGIDMYVLSANAAWNRDNEPELVYISYSKIKEWKYTDKGWFCYELCVPEPPEVSEIVDGSCMIRIKPMDEELREMSQKCVRWLGYQGNNLLCSDWDTDHMEELDYNGMYEYLYRMKYHKDFNYEAYPYGIPKDEFEILIMEYLPITEAQIQEYAVFDTEYQTYVWVQLGCSNYSPTVFGTSLPEVTNINKNEDGTITLTVDAVCEMFVCDDAVITHELTIRFKEDGSFQYLGNKIRNDGLMNIPDYQYRINRE